MMRSGDAVTQIRDFIYLDIQRLRSFASQLLEGVPETRTRSSGRTTEVAGEVRGRLPFLIEGAANTKAVLSAGSMVEAAVHHQLVSEVLDGLAHGHFLWPDVEAVGAPDGAFVLLRGQLQVSDPEALRSLVEAMPNMGQWMQRLGDGPQPMPTRADRRAGRSKGAEPLVSKPQADAIAGFLRILTPGTVRLRLLRDRRPFATAVVERDKFVEDLDRLVRRHGYLTSGQWEALAQVNARPDDELFAPSGASLMDVIERDMLGPMRMLSEVSGTATGRELSITPLAVYRAVPPHPTAA
jgi:hypothetical protein